MREDVRGHREQSVYKRRQACLFRSALLLLEHERFEKDSVEDGIEVNEVVDGQYDDRCFYRLVLEEFARRVDWRPRKSSVGPEGCQ